MHDVMKPSPESLVETKVFERKPKDRRQRTGLYTELNKRYSVREYLDTVKTEINETTIDQTSYLADLITRYAVQSSSQYTEIMQKTESVHLDVKSLLSENRKLRDLLAEKYPANKLLHTTVLSSIALLLALLAYFRFGITLIHPVLAFIMLTGTIIFSILAWWRDKE